MMTQKEFNKIKGTFYFPSDLHKELKHFATDSGERMNEVLTNATREGLKILKEKSSRRMRQNV